MNKFRNQWVLEKTSNYSLNKQLLTFSITKIGDMSYSGSMKTTYSTTSGNTITWTVAYPEPAHDGVTRYMNCTFEAGSYDGVTIA